MPCGDNPIAYFYGHVAEIQCRIEGRSFEFWTMVTTKDLFTVEYASKLKLILDPLPPNFLVLNYPPL
jgi:hypothetical protein